MHIYKVKAFARFQRREDIADASLVKAVRDATRGLIAADLGDGLIKQRVARPGEGKRGAYRTVIAYRRGDQAVFLYGFAKGTKSDLKPDERADLAKIGTRWLRASDEEIEAAIDSDELKEVDHGEEDESEG